MSGQEEAIRAALDVHAQEVMKLSQILHGEFLLQGGDDAVAKGRGGSSQDNVINV
jgi:hypothetical protein